MPQVRPAGAEALVAACMELMAWRQGKGTGVGSWPHAASSHQAHAGWPLTCTTPQVPSYARAAPRPCAVMQVVALPCIVRLSPSPSQARIRKGPHPSPPPPRLSPPRRKAERNPDEALLLDMGEYTLCPVTKRLPLFSLEATQQMDASPMGAPSTLMPTTPRVRVPACGLRRPCEARCGYWGS